MIDVQVFITAVYCPTIPCIMHGRCGQGSIVCTVLSLCRFIFLHFKEYACRSRSWRSSASPPPR